MPRQTTCERIARQAQRIARLELKLAKQKNHARRLDTRHKILLGGLVIKAKLDALPFPVLLGGLISLESQLCAEPHLLDVFHAKGEAVFLGFQSVAHSAASNKTPTSVGVTNSKLLLLRQTTRHKIQLGGLTIKAKLALLSKAQLLGALVTLSESFRRGPLLVNHYRQVGEMALAMNKHLSLSKPT